MSGGIGVETERYEPPLFFCFFSAAYLEMNGRFFGGRQIAASFYKEEKFDSLDLEPQRDEEKQ